LDRRQIQALKAWKADQGLFQEVQRLRHRLKQPVLGSGV
jgi:hypothetical protein